MATSETVYERQHRLHREAEMLKRLAADTRLSPRAAHFARRHANLARHARTLIDKHVVGLHFPEPTHHRDGAHAILAQLRRDGTDTPQHVEHALKLAKGIAHHIAATNRELMPYIVLRMPPPPHLMDELRTFSQLTALPNPAKRATSTDRNRSGK